MYKIISKLLAGRLKLVIGKLISHNQTVFLANRNMLDDMLLVNELVGYATRFKKIHVCFQS